MSFSSPEFICFLAGCVLLYYLFPKRYQWLILLVASYGFYLTSGPNTVVFLLFTTASTFVAGILLGRLNESAKIAASSKDKTASNRIKRLKKLVVTLVCTANFGMLFFLKYGSQTASLFGFSFPGILVPLGVSFYIFQSIGYMLDCYRGKYAPETNILKYALFVSFFPQIVQGPISRFDQLSPQLLSPHTFDADAAKQGIQLMMWGYFKKLVIADRAAVIVDTVFQNHTAYGGMIIAAAVLSYCIQLYCDFSGGIDITRGIARLLGIELLDNFRRPIFSQSLAEYWRRWHITLGSWMRDYVFYPMAFSKPLSRLGRFSRRKIGGKFGKILPTSVATFTIYFIIGIWHGLSFRYVFYGFWNGAIITSSLLLSGTYHKIRTRLHIEETSRWFIAFRLLRTWLLIFIGRYITRAPRLLYAFSMLWRTIRYPVFSDLWNGTLLTLGLPVGDLMIILLGTVFLIAVEYYQEKHGSVCEAISRKPFLFQLGALFVSLLVLMILGIFRGSYISSEFIYKQF